MNILLINPAHPTHPHISSVRAWQFARCLAEFGHLVVLLCAAEDSRTLDRGENLGAHDWHEPYVLAPAELRGQAAMDCLPGILRRVVTAFRLLKDGGRQHEWAAAAYASTMANLDSFSPDVLWTTFGKMEAVLLAKRISKSLCAPWVLDLKDNWELYVPPGLRWLMARRTGGWATLTANGVLTRDKGLRWQGSDPALVYSGVDDCFLREQERLPGSPSRFRINLVGGLYFEDSVKALFRALQEWEASLSVEQREGVELHYFGSDGAFLDKILGSCRLQIPVKIQGYVTAQKLAGYCQQAAVNCYIGHPGTFHHKLLELLACGRPVMVYPGEREESRLLATEVGGRLLEPGDVEEASHWFANLYAECQHGVEPNPNRQCERYSWARQSKHLEEVLIRVVKG